MFQPPLYVFHMLPMVLSGDCGMHVGSLLCPAIENDLFHFPAFSEGQIFRKRTRRSNNLRTSVPKQRIFGPILTKFHHVSAGLVAMLGD